MALSLSAALRLHLYVQVYGLTYLRLDAMIWMGLIAAGLALTGWPVWRGRSNEWLVVRAFVLGLGALDVCSFVNFSTVIAKTNLAQPRADRRDLDWVYLQQLGPMASGSIEEAFAGNPALTAAAGSAGFQPEWPQAQGWREWGFHTARVLR